MTLRDYVEATRREVRVKRISIDSELLLDLLKIKGGRTVIDGDEITFACSPIPDGATVIKAAWQVSAAWVAGRVEDKYGRQIPVRDAAAAKVMKEAAMSGDWECDHMTADDLLCKLLADLGCDKTVKAYEKVGKWYA